MRLLQEIGLSLALLALFVIALLGQALAGWRSDSEERRQHGQPAMPLPAYLASGTPAVYNLLRHHFAGGKLQRGEGWTRRWGWAWARRSAPTTLAEMGPRPGTGA